MPAPVFKTALLPDGVTAQPERRLSPCTQTRATNLAHFLKSYAMFTVQLDSSDGTLETGAGFTPINGWVLGESDWVWGWRRESSSAGRSPERASEGLEESGETDTKHGCKAEAQSGREEGRTDSASEKEAEAVRVGGAEATPVSVGEVLWGGTLCAGDEESEERGRQFNSVCEPVNTVALPVGWSAPSSSGSKFSCSDRGQNGSSTCRNTKVITLQTRTSNATLASSRTTGGNARQAEREKN